LIDIDSEYNNIEQLPLKLDLNWHWKWEYLLWNICCL
jgi:hypothetical protein